MQYLQIDLHIEPAAVQRIVHRLVGIEIPATPQVVQLMYHMVMHVVAEHLGQSGHQFLLAAGCKQLQRAAVDALHLDGRSALLQAFGLPGHMGQQIGDPFGTPLLEQGLERAEILQPE